LSKGGNIFLPLASFSCQRQAKGGGEGFMKGISNN